MKTGQATAPAHSQSAAPARHNRNQVRAVRRTLAGNFTKQAFAQIGGKECPRFATLTWKERDAFMAKPENSVVKDRYEAHLKKAEAAAAAPKAAAASA